MSSKKKEHAQPNEISEPKRRVTKAEKLIAEIKAKHAQQAPVTVNTTKKPKKNQRRNLSPNLLM